MSKQYKSEYAFPVPPPATLPNDNIAYADTGMELRDYFAAKIAAALVVRGTERSSNVASSAYWYADEMLKARNECSL